LGSKFSQSHSAFFPLRSSFTQWQSHKNTAPAPFHGVIFFCGNLVISVIAKKGMNIPNTGLATLFD